MIPIQTGNKLKLAVKGTATGMFFNISWMQITPDGRQVWSRRQEQTSTTQGETTTFEYNLIEGDLIYMSALQTSLTAPEPQTHIMAGIALDADATNEWILPLTSGNFTFNSPFIWPNTKPEQLTDGRGMMQVQNVGNPSGGQEWSFTVGDNTAVRIHTIEATLATSASAATRIPVLQVREGTNDIMRVEPIETVVANETKRFTWSSDFGVTGTVGTDVNQAGPSFLLSEGMVVETVTAGILEGDQWSDIHLYTSTWPWGN